MDTFVNQVHSRRRRRKYSEEFKRDAVAACLAPGVSMAAVALANGLNANVLRRWVNEHETSKSIAFSPKPSDGTSAQPVTDGSATAKALDYSLKRWVALTLFIDDGQCRSTTIGSRTRFVRLRLVGVIGYLPGHCGQVNVRPP